MGKIKNILGERYGKLVVIEYAGIDLSSYQATWKCQCDCGNTTVALSANLRKGNTLSCGCLRAEAASNTHRSHGMTRTPIYQRWWGMVTRCTDPQVKCWPNYGGRGIRVSERWMTFENFYADMGDIPFPGAEIDRIDPDGDYCPENCRWVTRAQNCRNRRNNIKVEVWGCHMCLSQACEKLGVAYSTIQTRVRRGEDPQAVIDGVMNQIICEEGVDV